MALANRLCVVVGGAGALGRAAVDLFRAKGARTVSIDFKKAAVASEEVLLSGDDFLKNLKEANAGLESARAGKSVDLVFCAAGGWAGGSIADDYSAMALEQLWRMNAQSAFLSAHLAAKTLGVKGMLVLTGAQAALEATPSMVAYGMTKAATHHLVRSVAADPALASRFRVAALLPATIDTQANRDAMGTADAHNWTPPRALAEQVLQWVAEPDSQPQNGSLWLVTTKGGQTTFEQEKH